MTNGHLQKINIYLLTPNGEKKYIIYCDQAELMILDTFMNTTVTEFIIVLEYIVDNSLFSTELHEIEDKYYHEAITFKEEVREKIIEVEYIQIL